MSLSPVARALSVVLLPAAPSDKACRHAFRAQMGLDTKRMEMAKLEERARQRGAALAQARPLSRHSHMRRLGYRLQRAQACALCGRLPAPAASLLPRLPAARTAHDGLRTRAGRRAARAQSEAMLEEDAARFDLFLKENDERVQAALRKADAEARGKQDKVRPQAPQQGPRSLDARRRPGASAMHCAGAG